jgi:hypothetical protein
MKSNKFSANINSLMLLLLIGISISRGILELFLSKNFSYLFQYLITVGIAIFIDNKIIKKIIIEKKENVVLLLITFFSAIFTYLIHNTVGLLWISIVFYYIIFITLFSNNELLYKINLEIIKFGIVLLFFILIFVALLQENDILLAIPFDNSFLKRPSSITGSYLHYPIVLSMISILFLAIWVNNNKKSIFLLLYFIGFIFTFFIYSRYGIMQVVLGLLLIKTYKKKVIFVSFIAIIFIILFDCVVKYLSIIKLNCLYVKTIKLFFSN